ncbi:TIGR02281 family clan AA aspartic protease [Aeoliella sp. SH292]|uniref:TIGR02281 family clan AA aspartic protease n=1 Tax=Aeoliella sp. SH292 TaxID=3454464 RepID=UPI003F9A5D96
MPRALPVFVLTTAFCLAASATQADEKSAIATLEAAGYKVTGSKLTTEPETEINADLKEINKLRKELLTATRELSKVQSQVDQHKANIAQITHQEVQLSTQLANVRQGDVESNNRIVGALNALQGQKNLMNGQTPQGEEALAKSRAGWSKAREAYLQLVLDLREKVEAASELYEKNCEDDSLKAAVEELNKSTGKSYSIDTPRTFLSAVRKLESLEDEVLTESISLRRQGNTLYVSVMVNGKYDKEMVVDSGASLILLPAAAAKELGVEPTKEDPQVELVMADGRTVSGRLVTLEEVRVGQFTVKEVEAAVLGPEAVSAEPLLGMSFLGNFKFELDAKAGTLTMVNVEGANPAEEKKPKRGRR